MARPAVKGPHVLAVAGDVFRAIGYAGASMDEIARQANVSKATLYRYYPSKELLFAAVLEAVAPPLVRDSAYPNSLGTDPEATLTALMLDGLRGILDPGYAALVRVVVAEGRQFPELAAGFVRKVTRPALRRTSEILAAEVASGRVRPMESAMAATQLVGMAWPTSSRRCCWVSTCPPPTTTCARSRGRSSSPSCTACSRSRRAGVRAPAAPSSPAERRTPAPAPPPGPTTSRCTE